MSLFARPLPNVTFTPLAIPEYAEWMTIEQRFEAFHIANPHVFDALQAMALGLRDVGVEKWGIAGLFEVLRWQSAIRTDGDPYKLNNNYRALYARMLMEREPRLAGFFDVRERRS